MPSVVSLQKVTRNSHVGNQAIEALQHDLTHASFYTLGSKPCTHMDWGSGQSSCRENDNFLDLTNHLSLGSSCTARASTASYGPLRSHSTVKVKGGGGPLLEPEAPCSSTSEPPPKGAVNGTSGFQALAHILQDMDSEQEFHDLAHEQLLQTGHQDLQASCQEYLRAPTQGHGQQLLADLQRMERLVYKHQGLQGDPPLIQANSGLIAQNLTSIAANDGNLCFGNSVFRCWSWLSCFTMEPTRTWGRLHQAFRAFLSSSRPCLLTQIHELMDVWAHFEDEQQADVGDFVGHLYTTAAPQNIGGKFFHLKSNGVLEEREQVPINLICPPGETTISLDELVNQWAKEEEGQHLYGAPDCLIFHIQRFQCQENMWTKHHRQLEVPTVITVPFSNDGVSISKAGYRTVAMILHHGETHHSGHFTAIYALDNAFWSVDDNQYPQPIGGLTPQQESEVLQVWLVHDHMEDDSDDHFIMNRSSKRAKLITKMS